VVKKYFPLNRITFVDFAKGYAIFTVVLYHMLQRVSLPPLWQQAIVFGGTGIHLFFLLSGFGLSLSDKPVAALPFYRRRLSKVWLPYVLALTISLIAALTLRLFDDRWDAWLAGVTQYQMFSERYIQSFGGHFWFISTIIQFYLVFPLLVRLRRAIGSDAWFFVLCLALSIAWWLTVSALDKGGLRTWNSFFLQFLWEFALGMVLARAYRQRERHPWPAWTRAPQWLLLPVGLVFTAIMVVMILRLGAVGKLFNDVPALLGYTALCGFAYWLGDRFLPPLKQFFLWINGFSFSLYLVHVLVLELYLGVFAWYDRAWTPALLLPFVPLALLAGWAFEPVSRWWVQLWTGEKQ
jgi:peptidoglycan/LPS O-acetylase OafA/YrhL